MDGLEYTESSYLFNNGLTLGDDLIRNASIKDASSPFLGGSTTITSDPTSQERGSCKFNEF